MQLSNGFSGCGFPHTAVVGKLIAEEIVCGNTGTLDITPLRFERFGTGSGGRG